MKIGIVGKICSGKTYIADRLIHKYNLKRYSFAKKIKDIAKDLFDMKIKDRKLLQQLGEKIKEIDENVWIKYLIRQIREEENVIIDDLRFSNEMDYLKKNNFIIIKINVDKETQIKRIKNLYKNNSKKSFRKLKSYIRKRFR